VILVVLFDCRTTLGLVKLGEGTVGFLFLQRAAPRRGRTGLPRGRRMKSTDSLGVGTARMSMINYASREINYKLVYYGPGLGGKTTISNTCTTRSRRAQGR
jgi:hypothetical protein